MALKIAQFFEDRDTITLVSPPFVDPSWRGTSDHVGVVCGVVVKLSRLATSWVVPYDAPAASPAEEVARLRDRAIEAAGVTKQDVARAMGVDRRSLSGFVAGEIRPSAQRLHALQVLAESAEKAAARFGVRAREVLAHEEHGQSVLDLIAAGRVSLTGEIAAAAADLGLVHQGVVAVRRRPAGREPLYLRARELWADRVDKPTAGGTVRDLAMYEQDLSRAAPAPVSSPRPRRKRI